MVEVYKDGLRCADGRRYELEEILWVTDAAAPAWLAEAGLAVDERGFVLVNAALQSVSHADVFAAGDVAAVAPYPREKAGVIAVRQGKPLARNLRRALTGRAPRPFVPQKKWLALISTGDQYAIASRGGWSVEGRWVWRWKDWIDRRFMRVYNELPTMAPGEPLALPHGLVGEDVRQELSALSHALWWLWRQSGCHRAPACPGTPASHCARRCAHWSDASRRCRCRGRAEG